jgi:MSHA pilin protein MshA
MPVTSRVNARQTVMPVPASFRPLRVRRAAGFTLIELVAAVVILGVVAVSAVSVITNLRRDARIAALKQLEGAVHAALAKVYATCLVTPTCDPAVPYYPSSGPPARVVIDGVTHQLQYGYPWQDRTADGGGLPALLVLNGFTDRYPLVTTGTPLTLDRAPDPAYCRVHYGMSLLPGTYPTVTVVTTGC